MSHPVRILEVGPRDGLQNEKSIIPLDIKTEFVNLLSRSGVSEIEVGAFVSPRWVPQMADSDELFDRIERNSNVVYSALVPNEIGFERALRAGVEKIAVFTAASETFNRRNINASISESLDRSNIVIRRSHAEKLPVRGYISTVFFCPYEGQMVPLSTIPVAEVLLELGVEEVCLADTVGEARPDDVRRVLEQVVKIIPPSHLAMHFHDTYHHAIENSLVAWREFGIEVFDSSAGGLGGCPYADGATGNVSTQKLVKAFRAEGADINIDVETINAAANLIQSFPESA